MSLVWPCGRITPIQEATERITVADKGESTPTSANASLLPVEMPTHPLTACFQV